MNIMELGALGEFVGAFGVIATLIYLAIQVRQNTRSLRSTFEKDVSSQFVEMGIQWAPTSIPDLMSKASEGVSNLSEEETSQFVMAGFTIFHAHQVAHDSWLEGNLSDRSWESFKQLLRSQLASAGMQAFWKIRAPTYKAEFREYVDGLSGDGVSPGKVAQLLARQE
jgi:hypothetical protein